MNTGLENVGTENKAEVSALREWRWCQHTHKSGRDITDSVYTLIVRQWSFDSRYAANAAANAANTLPTAAEASMLH